MASDDKSRKWKPKLLSWGLPLEFAVAKTLVASGFSVHSDYSYHRVSDGKDVEFSVDIRAIRTATAPEGSQRGCPFDLLIECKHRTRSMAWLFAPDPSVHSTPSEFELVRGVEAFSPWFLTDSAWWTNSSWLPTCYKGVEIDLGSGHVEDAELRRGLLQLQFAISPLLRSRIEVPATSLGVIENTPLLFTCILVTNVPLYVATYDLSPALIESSDELDNIAEEVPCLVVRVPAGRDFFQHSMRTFMGLEEVATRKGIRAAEEHRKADGVHDWELPSAMARRLATAGDEIEALVDVSNIFVCRMSYLDELLQRLIVITDRVSQHAVLKRPEHLRV